MDHGGEEITTTVHCSILNTDRRTDIKNRDLPQLRPYINNLMNYVFWELGRDGTTAVNV